MHYIVHTCFFLDTYICSNWRIFLLAYPFILFLRHTVDGSEIPNTVKDGDILPTSQLVSLVAGFLVAINLLTRKANRKYVEMKRELEQAAAAADQEQAVRTWEKSFEHRISNDRVVLYSEMV